MLEEMVHSTKRVLHWFNRNKWDILKGVAAMLTVTFADGTVSVNVTPENRKRYQRIPEVKPKYYDVSNWTNSTNAAIDMFTETGLEATSDYYRLEAVRSIEEIVENTMNLNDATKQYAIGAVRKIWTKTGSGYYRNEMNDVVLNIVNM